MTSYIGNLQVFDYNSSEWTIFKGRLTQFTKVYKVDDGDKCALLITHLSDESHRLVRNLGYPNAVCEFGYVELVLLLDNHFK